MTTVLSALSVAAAVLAPNAATLRPLHMRGCTVRMCDTKRPAVGKPDIGKPNVSRAAAEVTAELVEQSAAELDSKLDALWAVSPTIGGLVEDERAHSHLHERASLVGNVDSSMLLSLDEEAGMWPVDNLPQGDRHTAETMLWVDELSCIGCTWCADVARSTFQMTEPYGTAKVVQQGGDLEEVVDEAIDCCPNDCIYKCTRAELEVITEPMHMQMSLPMPMHHAHAHPPCAMPTHYAHAHAPGAYTKPKPMNHANAQVLEEHRSLGLIDDLMATFHTGGRLMNEGDGGKGVAIPHWKDPFVHQSWRKGDRYIKSRRLQMADPLLHHSGDATQMSLIGVQKVNEAPSPQNQDGRVQSEASPER